MSPRSLPTPAQNHTFETGPMTLVFSAGYAIDIGAHVFPTRKYEMVFSRLLEPRLAAPPSVVEPQIASWDDLLLVHTPGYLRKVRFGELSLTEQALLEIPWSAEVVDGFRLMSGGTVTAARMALERGVSVHVGGGFHHAFADHGEGFCLFNDVALAFRVLQREQRVRRAVVIDCDVHHGNGTAKLFGADPHVFTLSLHQQHNYPLVKPPSTLDIGLEDGTQDEEYLEQLHEALPVVMAHNPDVMFYLAGADPFVGDQLGGLSLTKGGLRQRDRLVIQAAGAAGVPIVITLAGGYAENVSDTIAIHVATAEEAMNLDQSQP